MEQSDSTQEQLLGQLPLFHADLASDVLETESANVKLIQNGLDLSLHVQVC